MVLLRVRQSSALPLRDGSGGGGGVGVHRLGGRCGDMAAVGKCTGTIGGERPVGSTPGGRCEVAGGGGGGGGPGGDGAGDNERLMQLLRKLWAQTDALFDTTIGAESMLERPIALRNPFLFYMGHLPAFDWNTLRPFIRHAPFNAAYDYLFSRGIDPDVEDPSICHAHPPPPPVWPPLPAVTAYRDDVRSRIVAAAAQLPRAALALAVEHDAMHVETLLYMAAQRRGGRVARDADGCCVPLTAYTLAAATEAATAAAVQRNRGVKDSNDSNGDNGKGEARVVVVPAGQALLGRSRPAELEPGRNFGADAGGDAPSTTSSAGAFGWDNEFPMKGVTVAAFALSALPVTVGAYAAFVAVGGYTTRRWWTEEDWRWVGVSGVRAPASWVPVDAAGAAVEGTAADGGGGGGGGGCAGAVGWAVRTMEAVLVPLVAAASWPVAVSLAEARAYAAWAGGRLPTEAEWHRAAFGVPSCPVGGRGTTDDTGGACAGDGGDIDGPPPPYPWGVDPPTPGVHGNFGFARRHPTDVGTHPAGTSALGVGDLIGDGWEWTASVFAPFEGFQAHPAYPTYSTDFFDGKHYVLKGASWATDTSLVRASFRNFYQARYPYVFAKFRVVYDCPTAAWGG
ncbi:hypothetical protein MMPV_000581 [Pyropia vietnamensis]